MSYTPPPDASVAAAILEEEKLAARFHALLEQATSLEGTIQERIEARSKCGSLFESVLRRHRIAKPEVKATGTDADLRRIAEGGLAHQVRSAAKVVFHDTPGVDAHALEHGDPCLWVGAMAATIDELRQRAKMLEDILDRYLPVQPTVLIDDAGHMHQVSK